MTSEEVMSLTPLADVSRSICAEESIAAITGRFVLSMSRIEQSWSSLSMSLSGLSKPGGPEEDGVLSFRGLSLTALLQRQEVDSRPWRCSTFSSSIAMYAGPRNCLIESPYEQRSLYHSISNGENDCSTTLTHASRMLCN